MTPMCANLHHVLAAGKVTSTLALLTLLCTIALGPYAHALVSISAGSSQAGYIRDNQVDYAPGELIIELGGESREALEKRLDSWNAKIVDELPEIQAYLVRFDKPSISATLREAQSYAGFVSVEPNYYVHSMFTPNDPLFAEQWGLLKVRADLAWDTGLGTRSIIVAVIDTGIDYLHEDLAANYVPLGYDWVNNDNDPLDDSTTGHGTRVAGIIASVTNNGIGIAGLAQVSIIAEKVLDSSGSGTVWNVIKAVTDAVEKGARITNNSYGNYVYSDIMRSAFEYAWSQGVLNVAAAGNDDTDQSFYPAAYGEFVISVAGTDQIDGRYTSSNHGNWIELSAPATDILSTVPHNSYGEFTGTSMSSAFVTGAAALLWSHQPGLSADEVRRRLQETAIDLGDPGKDPFFGYGRIDMFSPPQSTPPPVGGTIVEPDRTQVSLLFAMEVMVVSIISIALLKNARKIPTGSPPDSRSQSESNGS